MIAAPVGPIGLLCIRRTIQRGVVIGLATGLGAACADAIFGAIAAFSVSAIVEFLKHYSPALRILGGMFMLAVAWRTWHDMPHEPPKQSSPAQTLVREERWIGRSLSALIGSFIITLTNPITMFATLAVVATFGELQNGTEALTIVSGIFVGSALWWVLLSGSVALIRGHFTEYRVTLINRSTACALALLAIWAAASGIKLLIQN